MDARSAAQKLSETERQFAITRNKLDTTEAELAALRHQYDSEILALRASAVEAAAKIADNANLQTLYTVATGQLEDIFEIVTKAFNHSSNDAVSVDSVESIVESIAESNLATICHTVNSAAKAHSRTKILYHESQAAVASTTAEMRRRGKKWRWICVVLVAVVAYQFWLLNGMGTKMREVEAQRRIARHCYGEYEVDSRRNVGVCMGERGFR